MRRTVRKGKHGSIEANLVPILSLMFLLIPALLLAMEVADFSSIEVRPPRYTPTHPGPAAPEPEQLGLKVFVMEDGFRLTTLGQQHGATAGRDRDRSRPTIPVRDPSAAVDDLRRYDYDALESAVRRLKDLFPHESLVAVSAENHIPLQVLVATFDSLRGTGCDLRGAMRGETVPEECLFWDVVVEAGI